MNSHVVKSVGNDFVFGSLRSLSLADTDLMLEWMHDEGIAGVFQQDFLNMKVEDVNSFIENSWTQIDCIHLAICDEEGIYLGTVSLKNIDVDNLSAEYAISTRKIAHGSGIAFRATQDIIKFAFDKLGLHRVYLNVRSDNERARHFYEKFGFVYEGCSKDAVQIDVGKYVDLLWYAVIND